MNLKDKNVIPLHVPYGESEEEKERNLLIAGWRAGFNACSELIVGMMRDSKAPNNLIEIFAESLNAHSSRVEVFKLDVDGQQYKE